jgi:hypothetical protein
MPSKSDKQSVDSLRDRPAISLYQGGQLQIRLIDSVNVNVHGVLLQLRGASCNLATLSSGSAFRRVNLRLPIGLRYRLVRSDDLAAKLYPHAYHYTDKVVTCPEGETLRCWLSEDAGSDELAMLASYPILVEHLDHEAVRVHLPDGWDCINAEKDHRPFHVATQQYADTLMFLGKVLKGELSVEALEKARIHLERVRDWNNLVPALSRELERVGQEIERQIKLPSQSNTEREAAYQSVDYTACLKRIIAVDTDRDGNWGPCAEIAAQTLKEAGL